MAKKKDKGSEKKVIDKLSQLISRMSDEDWDDLADCFYRGDSKAQLNNNYYRYKRPDYSKTKSDVFNWFGPFWNVQLDDDKKELCHFVRDDAERFTDIQRQDEIHDYFYSLFGRFNKDYKNNAWRLYGPLWILETFHYEDKLDLVLEVLRQDAYFYDQYLDNNEKFFASVLCQLGKNQLPVLVDFMSEQGLIPSSKAFVFDAIVEIALSQPSARLQAISAILKYLDKAYALCKQGAVAVNIDHYAYTLATAHIKEALPMLRKLYADLNLPSLDVEGIEEVESIMNDETIKFRYKYFSFNEYLENEDYFDIGFGFNDEDIDDFCSDDDDDWDFDDDDDDEDWDIDDEDEEYDIFWPVDDNEDQKRYTIKVELRDAPEEISRTLDVPSNIKLFALKEVIMKSFGRTDELTIFEYHKGLDRYLSDDMCMVLGYTDTKNAQYFTLQQLLKKKNDQAELFVDGKMQLTHQITLIKKGKYADDDPEEWLIDLVSAKGVYPVKSCKSMDEHAKKIASKKYRKLNETTIIDDLRRWEWQAFDE